MRNRYKIEWRGNSMVIFDTSLCKTLEDNRYWFPTWDVGEFIAKLNAKAACNRLNFINDRENHL